MMTPSFLELGPGVVVHVVIVEVENGVPSNVMCKCCIWVSCLPYIIFWLIERSSEWEP